MTIHTTIQKHRVQWILNALPHIKPESLVSRGIASWVASNCGMLGVNLPRGFTVQEIPKKKKGADVDTNSLMFLGDPAEENQALKAKRISRFSALAETLTKSLQDSEKSKDLVETALEKNLKLLGEVIKLSPEEYNTLLFYIDFRANDFADIIALTRQGFGGDDYFEKVSWLLNETPNALRQKLSPQSVLRNFITYDTNRRGWGNRLIDHTADNAYQAEERFVQAMSEPSVSAGQIIARLLGPTPTTELTLDDFSYLGERLTYFVETLRGVVEQNGHTRKNSSLYGDPGVGKTELTAVIAQHLNVPLYAIGLSHLNDENVLSDTAKEPSRQDRLMALRRASFLVKAAGMKCLFLFDEADDVLRDPNEDKDSDRASKGYLNWLLDTNNVPTVFVTNNIHLFEESTIRRILPTLHIPHAPRDVQTKILFGYAQKYKMDITQDQAAELTNVYGGLTSGVVETILYKTSLRHDMGTDPECQFEALKIGFSESVAALNSGAPPIPALRRTAENFDPRLVQSTLDIPALIDDFKQASSLQGLSLCLSGPQGSGKKTLFQYMADQLKLGTHFINFGSLYGASGFNADKLSTLLQDAGREKTMLIFDDVEKLCRESEWRKLDSHPFFRVIDQHGLPIGVSITTTDVLEMDQKKLWRLSGQFTFTANISPLDSQGQVLALERIVELGREDACAVARGLEAEHLVVGDFVRVAHQMRYRPTREKNPDKILEAFRYNLSQSGDSVGAPHII